MFTDSFLAGLFVFLAVAAGVVFLGYYLRDRPSRDQRAAVRRLRALGTAEPGAEVPAGSGERAGWLVAAVAKLGAVGASGECKAAVDLRTRLALAGYAEPERAAVYFAGMRFVLVVLLALAGVTAATAAGASWKKTLLWTTTGAAAGFLVPKMVLASRVKKRQRLIRNALPDALDVMVLCVEGGASLNAAIQWVTEEIQPVHPVLGAELAIVQREMQLGLSPGEAFRAFADRCGIAEARDLAGALLQSEKYGASVGKALRGYAESARVERQLWAEEVAQKASVKIVFPMLLCIFPAIFIVLLGPAAFQMSKLFAR